MATISTVLKTVKTIGSTYSKVNSIVKGSKIARKIVSKSEKFIRSLAFPCSSHEIPIIWLYGEGGVGKSRVVKSLISYCSDRYGWTSMYIPSSTKIWFDNYDNHDIIVLDDFVLRDPELLLNWTTRGNAFMVADATMKKENKTNKNVKMFIICANVPGPIFPADGSNDIWIEPVLRRITLSLHLTRASCGVTFRPYEARACSLPTLKRNNAGIFSASRVALNIDLSDAYLIKDDLAYEYLLPFLYMYSLCFYKDKVVINFDKDFTYDDLLFTFTTTNSYTRSCISNIIYYFKKHFPTKFSVSDSNPDLIFHLSGIALPPKAPIMDVVTTATKSKINKKFNLFDKLKNVEPKSVLNAAITVGSTVATAATIVAAAASVVEPMLKSNEDSAELESPKEKLSLEYPLTSAAASLDDGVDVEDYLTDLTDSSMYTDFEFLRFSPVNDCCNASSTKICKYCHSIDFTSAYLSLKKYNTKDCYIVHPDSDIPDTHRAERVFHKCALVTFSFAVSKSLGLRGFKKHINFTKGVSLMLDEVGFSFSPRHEFLHVYKPISTW